MRIALCLSRTEVLRLMSPTVILLGARISTVRARILYPMTAIRTRKDVAPVDAAELVVILGTLAAGLLLIGLSMTVGVGVLFNGWATFVMGAAVVSGVGAAILWGVTHAKG